LSTGREKKEEKKRKRRRRGGREKLGEKVLQPCAKEGKKKRKTAVKRGVKRGSQGRGEIKHTSSIWTSWGKKEPDKSGTIKKSNRTAVKDRRNEESKRHNFN